MICSRCGHADIPSQASACPNCGFKFKKKSRSLTTTTSFRALSARRKMLTERHYALPFSLGDEVFSSFKIRDLLGQGPLGVVYLVTNERGDQYALKVIHKRWRAEMDLDTLQGAYLALDDLTERQRLNLPVKVLIQDENVGLLSPHLSGLTVRKVMSLRKASSKAFKIEELKQLVSGVGDALKHLHSIGLAHGGVKPENFFVSVNDDSEQEVTLSDTCLASGVGVEAYHRAQRATGLGHYLAPELAQGELSLASDLFSLSAFIFEGLTGHAYQSKKNIRDLLPIQGVEPLEIFLARGLHADSSQRHANINELLTDFDAVTEALAQLEGSPFVSSETEPRGESVVARFNVDDPTEESQADPLLGVQQDASVQGTPPPLPASASIVGLITPPPLPPVTTSQVQPRTNLLRNETVPSSRELLQQISQSNVQEDLDVSVNASLDFIPIVTTPIVSSGAQVREPEVDDLIPAQLSRGVPQMRPRRTVVSQSSTSSTSLTFWVSMVGVLFSMAFGVYYMLTSPEDSTDSLNVAQRGVAVSLPTSSPTQVKDVQASSSKVTSVAQGDLKTAPITTDKLSSTKIVTETNTVGKMTAVEVAAAAKAAADEAAAAKATADKAAAAKAAADKAAAAKATADKAAAAKAAADKAAAAKATADKAAAAKATADKAAAAKATADKAAAAKAAAAKATADKAAAKAAADKAAAKAAADKADADRKTAKREAAAKRDADREAADRETADREARAKRDEAQRKAARKAELEKRAREDAERKAKAQTAAERVPPKAQVKISATELKCPAGMILKTTARFPRRSVRRGKIKGKKAIAMALNGKAYCIDAYEYPGRGRRPKTNVTFKGAQSLCAQANKRLCTPSEWKRGCVGRRGAAYPYGKKFNPKKCVTEDGDGEERRLMKSGSMKKCKSASGLYDMSGNVSEWTEGQRVFGGYYASDEDDAKCSSGGRRSPSTRRGYIGFRCCTDFRDK